MTREEAKAWLGIRYAMHPVNRVKRLKNPLPPQSPYADVDVRATFDRVKLRQESLIDIAEQTRQRLRLIHGKVAA